MILNPGFHNESNPIKNMKISNNYGSETILGIIQLLGVKQIKLKNL